MAPAITVVVGCPSDGRPGGAAIRNRTAPRAAALLLAALWLLLAPSVATAHAELVSSSPAANASLKAAPTELSMTFTEPIDASSASIQLFDENQRPIDGVGSVSTDAPATTAKVTLPKLDKGIYTVDWRVTSAADGHVTAGIFAFLIDPTGTIPAPTSTATSSSPSADAGTIAARWFALLTGLTLFGVAIFWLASARPAMRRSGVGELAGSGIWAVLAISALFAFAGLAIYLTLAALPFTQADGGHAGHGLAATAFPLDFAAPFGTTSFAWAMRLALAATAAAFLVATGRYFFSDAARRDRRSLDGSTGVVLAVVGALAAVALAGSSIAGHAAALGGPLFGLFDWLHLVAVGTWLGTLPGLVLLAVRARDSGAWRSVVGGALRRHSRIALVAAPIVAVTGIANSPIVLGSPRQLIASDYGDLLLAKALLFSVAVAIGSANYFLVRRQSFRRVLALVGAEIAVGTLAVVAAAGLVTIQPAAGRLPVLSASSVDSLHLYGQAGDNTVHAAVSVPAPGTQTYQVTVGNATTGDYRVDVQKVFLVFEPPSSAKLPSERIELQQQTDGRLWETTGAYTPIVGDWKLEVVVRRLGKFDVSTTFDMPVVKPLPPREVPPPDTGLDVPQPLAALWLVIPDGTLGWIVPVALLGLVVVLSVVERRRSTTRRGVAMLRVGLVIVALLAGIGVGSRAAVEAANAAPTTGSQNPIAADPDSIRRGSNLYLANCANCHGTRGAGDGPTAQGLLPPPGPLAPVVRSQSDGQLAYVISNGMTGTPMPPFAASLSENDRWDIVNYLRSVYSASDAAAAH